MPLPLNSPEISSQTTMNTRTSRGFIAFLAIIATLGLGLFIMILSFTETPKTFPVNVPITIPEGSTAKEVTELFAQEGYVKSSLALYLNLMWWHDPSAIKASTYIFSTPLTPRQIAEEITRGHYAHDLLKLTLIEGERATAIAERAEAVLPQFDKAVFLELAIPAEGKLFPDTYFLPASFTAEDLFALLTTTYGDKIAPWQDAISAHRLTEDEILVLASVIEREANTPESMKMVSGILQNRLTIDMPLQADASIEYVLDKPLEELTPEDLKIDSPYNTYLNLGLPPTPIGNPGIDAIVAVLEPTPSEYYYYITSLDGTFYYAKNFDEHRQNIARYLR
jgi:UPF0755 protein